MIGSARRTPIWLYGRLVRALRLPPWLLQHRRVWSSPQPLIPLQPLPQLLRVLLLPLPSPLLALTAPGWILHFLLPISRVRRLALLAARLLLRQRAYVGPLLPKPLR